MTLSAQAREYMAKRDKLSERETDIIDHAFNSIYQMSKWLNVKVATDDRAAELEASLIRFIIDSREK